MKDPADRNKPGTIGLTLIQTMLVVAIAALVLSIAVRFFSGDWDAEQSPPQGAEQSETIER